MAKKIRFPLKMKNGAEVRTLDELKENFDLESVLGYFTDGKLSTWLADRYYDEKAEAVAVLSADMPDLNAKLCEILEVEYEAETDKTDLEYIQRRSEKLKILSSVTADQDILKNIDLVAMNQDELYDILDEGSNKAYLYGDKFEIPFGKKNISYIGVNNPVITIDKTKYVYEYNKAGISFKNVRYEDTVNPYVTSGEKLFLEGKFKEAFPIIEQAANNGNPRAMYIMARYCNDGYETVIINEKERNNWCEKAYPHKEPLSMYGYAAWCLNDKQDEENKLYSQIFDDIESLAESGDALAQGIIGYMYNNGVGAAQDKSIAVKWIMEAAKQGYPYAQYYLGYMYNNAQGVAQDYAEAVKWYRKSAEQGHVYGQYNLGCMYDNGKGVTQDYAEAVKWYRKAAEQGYASGQCNLGYMYSNGYGVAQDYAEAVKWYRKSAEQGYAYGQCNLGYMYENGRGVTQDYAEAVKWYRKAAEQGYARGQSSLGCMYDNGKGVTQDYAEAVKWYRKAAEQGYAYGQCNLGYMYQYGNGVTQDYAEAVKWYRKSAEQGYAYGQCNLGYMYSNGYGVAQDKSKAIELYKKAAEQGNETAKNNLRNLGVIM